jgi:hypothetical protein
MMILRHGVVKVAALVGECPRCRCRFTLKGDADLGRTFFDECGNRLVRCPEEGCGRAVVVQQDYVSGGARRGVRQGA